MSTKTFCDSCGKEIDEANPSAVGHHDINGVVDAIGIVAVNGKDICLKCVEKYLGKPPPQPDPPPEPPAK